MGSRRFLPGLWLVSTNYFKECEEEAWSMV